MYRKLATFMLLAIIVLILTFLVRTYLSYIKEAKTTEAKMANIEPNLQPSNDRFNALMNSPTIRKEALKKEFQSGPFHFTVEAVAKLDDVYDYKAPPGAIIIAMAYFITNSGNSTIPFQLPPIVLVDNKGRHFLPSRDCAWQISIHEPALAPTELQPGLRRELTVGFEVPTEVLERTMIFEFSDPTGNDSAIHKLPIYFKPNNTRSKK